MFSLSPCINVHFEKKIRLIAVSVFSLAFRGSYLCYETIAVNAIMNHHLNRQVYNKPPSSLSIPSSPPLLLPNKNVVGKAGQIVLL